MGGGWLLGNSTNTSASKRARTKFKESGGNVFRPVGKGKARHLTVGHVASSHQGAAYVPVACPMPLNERLELAMGSYGIEPLEVGIELGIYEQELAKAQAKAVLMAALGMFSDDDDDEFDPVAEAEENTVRIIEEYLAGAWIPTHYLYAWFDMFK